ncbi:unnamed protein product [Macrosiphum euphorbiae]|nr:unnamed protein product [Macrosiphum euphorbiae]
MFVGVDGRLGRTPPNKTSDKIIQEVKNHIQSFPKMEFHYCRHDTKKLYLSSDLNISIMYRLYCSTSPAEPVSKIVYTRVFHEFDPALSFYKPKKDQCTKCNNYNNCVASNLITDKIKTDWSEHKRREKESLDMKKEDKNIAIDNKGKHFRSVSFDLQAVLNLPHAGDSQIYYKRKLSVFNFTIYEHHSANGYCYVWDELNGGKGSTEIGTCLLQYLENLPETVEHVVTYSDTCGGQNRNKYTMTAIMYAVQTIDHLQIIDIKYMESGHSYLEADSMHACIERAKKHKTIYTTREWSLLIQMARIKPQSYIVNVNTYKDFYDFQSMASGTNWNRNIEGMSDKMKWLKIKWIRFEKSKPFMVQFKYNLSDEKFMELNVMPNTPKKTPKNTSAIVLKKILKYKDQIPVSEAKKSDLLSLLKSGVIPKEYDSFYNSIPTTKNKKNTIPWSETDSDEETT